MTPMQLLHTDHLFPRVPQGNIAVRLGFDGPRSADLRIHVLTHQLMRRLEQRGQTHAIYPVGGGHFYAG